MATATYGTLQEFKPELETITAYLERLKAYYEANDIPTAKRVPVLLSVIGPKTYSILRSLVAPDSPQSRTLDNLTKVLKTHYDPKPIVIAERYHFHIRTQASNEGIAEYIAELRRLASSCEFGAFLDEALRDRFVCGLRSESARRKLLTEAKLTLAKAVEFAQCMELAERNAISIKGTESSVQKLSYAPRNFKREQQQQQKPCYRCGRTNHDATKCRFIDATCNHCGKKGHISPACRSKQLNRKQPIVKHQTQTKYVANNSEDEEFYLNKVGSQSVKPILVQLEIGGVNLDTELDTGAAYTIISERTRKSFFSKLKVRPSSIRLKTYTDEAINVLGQLHVHVKYNDQQSPLVLLVVEGDRPPLLGRNWLRYI